MCSRRRMSMRLDASSRKTPCIGLASLSPILCCAVGSPGSTKNLRRRLNWVMHSSQSYFLTLQLSPAFMDYLGRPGVIDEIDASRREGRLPSVEKLKSLGLPENFSRALISVRLPACTA